ncbi:bacteriocin [Spiroplasma endosymbiont of Crioceris asparagi]|uniref:bacteriocin n=1 Tax=Spiroplasma endosymbiont of Crioceris asparagi TaxID=3066286 RepID=UPI0030CE56F6
MTKLTDNELEKIEGGAITGAFFDGIAKVIEAPFSGLINLIGAINTTILSGKEHDHSTDMSYKIGNASFSTKHGDGHSHMTQSQIDHMYSNNSSII